MITYDLWGDAVNIASRMEGHGVGGVIQITRDTYEQIRGEFVCERRGVIHVKGKGEMEVWHVVARRKPGNADCQVLPVSGMLSLTERL